ncbi:MAG: mechanosensitive ion channel [Candidatus Bathyarchaeia archaeon]
MKISKYAIYIIGFFVIVSFSGFDLSSVIVGLGAFSIAISFATSTIIQNLVSGILVQADKSFKVGDEIKVLNFEGKVVKISVRTTVLETGEGHAIFIPNSVFLTNAVIRKNKKRQGRQDQTEHF